MDSLLPLRSKALLLELVLAIALSGAVIAFSGGITPQSYKNALIVSALVLAPLEALRQFGVLQQLLSKQPSRQQRAVQEVGAAAEAAHRLEEERARRLEEERARRLEEERARRFLEEENAELRAALASRLEEEQAERKKAERRYSTLLGYRTRGIENEPRGGWGQENVAVLRELEQLGLDKQNSATIGRVLNAGGSLAHAEEAPDGRRMYAQIRIPEDALIFSPSILVMPHAGELEIEFFNDDTNTHSALVPSNGDYQFIWLPNHSRGKVSVTLDGPGYYWFSSPIGNDEGQGLMGVIAVLGDVPEEAKLDRPPQPRP